MLVQNPVITRDPICRQVLCERRDDEISAFCRRSSIKTTRLCNSAVLRRLSSHTSHTPEVTSHTRGGEHSQSTDTACPLSSRLLVARTYCYHTCSSSPSHSEVQFSHERSRLNPLHARRTYNAHYSRRLKLCSDPIRLRNSAIPPVLYDLPLRLTPVVCCRPTHATLLAPVPSTFLRLFVAERKRE